MGDADHVRAAVQAYADNGVDPTIVFAAAVGRGPPRDGQHHAPAPRVPRPNDRRSVAFPGPVLAERLRRRWPRPRCRTRRRTPRASRSSPSASGRPSPSSITCFASPIATTAPLPSSAAQCSADVLDLVLRHDPVDEPDRERLVGAHLPPAPDQLLGARRADEPGQPLRAARARDDAEQDLGLPDARVVGGDAQVARDRELEAAAERVPPDRGDDRTRDRRDRVERVAERLLDHARGFAWSPNSSMSAPAANAFSLPATTTAFTAASAAERARRVADCTEHAPVTADSSAGG